MRIRPFVEDEVKQWDDFVHQCWNANFLHSRQFLSYHGDRFSDSSVWIENDKGKTVGVFPAAPLPDEATTICSHPGTTYGGIVHSGELRGENMQTALVALLDYYRRVGFKKIIYKAVPPFYHLHFAEDDLYALTCAGAKLIRRDLAAAIDFSRRCSLFKGRKWARGKARQAGVIAEKIVANEESIAKIARLIDDTLKSRHQATPTHSAEELTELARRFPKEIDFWVGRVDGEMVCCAVVFVFLQTMHTQYLAANTTGFSVNALDAVIHALLENAQERNFARVSFGTSSEDAGRRLNAGLHHFKIGFGGGAIVHDHYALNLTP